MVVRRVVDLELVIEGPLPTRVAHDNAVTGTWLLRLLLLQVLALGLLVRVRTSLVIAIRVNGCRRVVDRRELLGTLVEKVQIKDVVVVMMVSGLLISTATVGDPSCRGESGSPRVHDNIVIDIVMVDILGTDKLNVGILLEMM